MAQHSPQLRSPEDELEGRSQPPQPAPEPVAEPVGPASAPSPAAVLAMQRNAGNQAVQRYLSGNGAVLQRKEGDASASAEPSTAPPVPGTPVPGAATAKDTRTLKITAIFDDVPGESNVGVRKAKDTDALWFDPLKTHSDAPDVAESTVAKGVLTSGQQQIDSFAAPVTSGGAKPVGRGSITAQLKYTSAKNDSYNVEVTGLTPAQDKKATPVAKEFVKSKIEVFGDVDEIAKQTEAHLAESFPGAKVAITPKRSERKSDPLKDMGRSHFHYKLKGNAGILINVQVVPASQKQTTSSGSKTTGSSTEDTSSSSTSSEKGKVDIDKKVTDSEKSKSASKELVETTYNEAVVKTIDDYITATKSIHEETAQDLAKKVVTDTEYNAKETEKAGYSKKKVTDYTKNVEKGEKSKDNWAEKIKKGVKVVRKATSIPWLDKIKGIGWISRKIKGWQLDLIEAGADIFAETGKAQYEDTKVKSTETDEGSSTKDKDTNITRRDETKTTEQVKKDYQSDTKEEWERHMEEVTKISKEYRSKTTKESSSSTDKAHDESYKESTQKDKADAAEEHKKTQNQSVTTSFQVSQNWTFSVPVVRADPIGDVEVAGTPYGKDPDEDAPAKAP